MNRYIIAVVLSILAGVAIAAEVNDLSPAEGRSFPDNLPLGLPGIAWWLFLIVIGCAGFWWVFKRVEWVRERLTEPSTHLSLSVSFGFTGVFLNSLVLDPAPFAQALMLTGAIFAFVGLIGKDKEGPLL